MSEDSIKTKLVYALIQEGHEEEEYIVGVFDSKDKAEQYQEDAGIKLESHIFDIFYNPVFTTCNDKGEK